MAWHFNMAISTTIENQARTIQSLFNDSEIELSNGKIAKIISSIEKVKSDFVICISAKKMHVGLNDSDDELLDKEILLEFENNLIDTLRKREKFDFDFALFQCEIYDDFINRMFLKELLEDYQGDKEFFEKRYSGLIISNKMIHKYGFTDIFEMFNDNYQWIDNKNKSH